MVANCGEESALNLTRVRIATRQRLFFLWHRLRFMFLNERQNENSAGHHIRTHSPLSNAQ